MLENDLRPTTYDVFKEWLSWNSFSLNFVFLCFKIVVKHGEVHIKLDENILTRKAF